DGPVLTPAAGRGPGSGPHPRRGRVLPAARTALRDPGRGGDGGPHGRGPGGHVHRTGGDRCPARRPGGTGPVPGDEPGRRRLRRAVEPRRSGGRRQGGRAPDLGAAGRDRAQGAGPMSADSLAELRRRAAEWIEADPDPETAAELAELLRRCDAADTGERQRAVAELEDRFSGPLQFGTAGWRGHLRAGEHRRSRAVVSRAAAGLQQYLADVLGPDEPPVVVIGYDARYGSHAFAQDTAYVIAAAGGLALLLPEPLPTPVLAFALRHLQADAGVMVTA